jgi:predicted Rossmann-fold nucleotide-binding protein
VLFGTEYWKPVLDWVHDCALRQGMINHEDASLISVTDEVSEAVSIIKHMAYQRMREM